MFGMREKPKEHSLEASTYESDIFAMVGECTIDTMAILFFQRINIGAFYFHFSNVQIIFFFILQLFDTFFWQQQDIVEIFMKRSKIIKKNIYFFYRYRISMAILAIIQQRSFKGRRATSCYHQHSAVDSSKLRGVVCYVCFRLQTQQVQHGSRAKLYSRRGCCHWHCSWCVYIFSLYLHSTLLVLARGKKNWIFFFFLLVSFLFCGNGK